MDLHTPGHEPVAAEVVTDQVTVGFDSAMQKLYEDADARGVILGMLNFGREACLLTEASLARETASMQDYIRSEIARRLHEATNGQYALRSEHSSPSEQ